MKQIIFVKAKTVSKIENIINETLAKTPNSECVGIFTRGGGNIWGIIQSEEDQQ